MRGSVISKCLSFAFLMSCVGAASALADAVAFIPPGAFLELRDSLPNRVRLRLETAQLTTSLKPELDKAFGKIRSSNPILGAINPQLMGIQFDDFANGSKIIRLDIDIDTSLFRCNIRPRWQLPKSRVFDASIANDNSKTDCRTGNAALQALGLIPKIEDELTRTVVETISKGKLVTDPDTVNDWKREDPEWAEFVAPAFAEMMYCTGPKGEHSICVDFTWADADALLKWKAKLIKAAPPSSGEADKEVSRKAAAEFRQLAEVHNIKPSSRVPSMGYPAGYSDDGVFVDFDMTLFGGLICYAGEPRGCETVKFSQGSDGRFWRSPDRVGSIPTNGAPFSGDMFNGVVAYVLASNDKDAVRRYLRFISGNSATVLGRKVYKSCREDDAYQCVLGGAEWFFLNEIAKRYGLAAEVPVDVRDVKAAFGFTTELLAWQAMLAPAGYRLHLTAVQLMLARNLVGADDPALKQVAAILAGRQAQNPFHLFVHLGSDLATQDELLKQCNSAAPHTSFWEWAWQAPKTKEGWKYSMRWDCQFMHLMVAR